MLTRRADEVGIERKLSAGMLMKKKTIKSAGRKRSMNRRS